MIRMMRGATKKVAFISSYPPRKCGIATFTSDLIKGVRLTGGEEFEPLVVAMESATELEYDGPVKFKIRKDVKYDYVLAADYVNYSDVEIVFLQHEFGLFGGEGGSYLNLLLEKLNKPVITTLHTVLEKPSAEYLYSLIDICEASDKVIVMNKRGIKMLRDTYGVPERKIRLIPHGIPDMPFVDGVHHKCKLGLAGRKTILTFGLLGRNKGIEVMLKALPKIVEADRSVIYIVLGVTHPELFRHEGLSYKLELERMVADLGLDKHVAFHHRFVDDEELSEYLGAADLYVTPYLHREQLTSGTLAFAVGAGKAVVSTAYWAAEELLAQGRGKLIRFGDSEHLARSIVELLKNNSLLSEIKRRAYEYGRSMTWPKVGQTYWKLLRAQVPSMPICLRPGVDSQDWTRTVYNREQIYQST